MDIVKKIINTLRSQYRRELKMVKVSMKLVPAQMMYIHLTYGVLASSGYWMREKHNAVPRQPCKLWR